MATLTLSGRTTTALGTLFGCSVLALTLTALYLNPPADPDGQQAVLEAVQRINDRLEAIEALTAAPAPYAVREGPQEIVLYGPCAVACPSPTGGACRASCDLRAVEGQGP